MQKKKNKILNKAEIYEPIKLYRFSVFYTVYLKNRSTTSTYSLKRNENYITLFLIRKFHRKNVSETHSTKFYSRIILNTIDT